MSSENKSIPKNELVLRKAYALANKCMRMSYVLPLQCRASLNPYLTDNVLDEQLKMLNEVEFNLEKAEAHLHAFDLYVQIPE